MFSFGPEMMYKIPALLLALTIHEYAHAQVADSLGDPTPKMMGRLTLNPIAHVDFIGLLMLAVVGFGWAKPVEVNSRYFGDPLVAMRKVSAAGPLANIFLAFLATIFVAVLGKIGVLSVGVYSFLLWLKMYNIWFALFNLLPIPPLDGSKILLSYLSGENAYKYLRIEPYGMYIMIGLLITGLVGVILNPLAQSMIGLMNSVVKIIF